MIQNNKALAIDLISFQFLSYLYIQIVSFHIYISRQCLTSGTRGFCQPTPIAIHYWGYKFIRTHALQSSYQVTAVKMGSFKSFDLSVMSPQRLDLPFTYYIVCTYFVFNLRSAMYGKGQSKKSLYWNHSQPGSVSLPPHSLYFSRLRLTTRSFQHMIQAIDKKQSLRSWREREMNLP